MAYGGLNEHGKSEFSTRIEPIIRSFSPYRVIYFHAQMAAAENQKHSFRGTFRGISQNRTCYRVWQLSPYL